MDAPRSPDSLIHVLGTLTALAFAACVTRALLAAFFRAIGPGKRSPSETSVPSNTTDTSDTEAAKLELPATSAREPSVERSMREARLLPMAPLSAANALFAFAVVSVAVSLVLLGSASGLTRSSGFWILVALPLALSLIVQARSPRLRSRPGDAFALAARRARSLEPRAEDGRPLVPRRRERFRSRATGRRADPFAFAVARVAQVIGGGRLPSGTIELPRRDDRSAADPLPRLTSAAASDASILVVALPLARKRLAAVYDALRRLREPRDVVTVELAEGGPHLAHATLDALPDEIRVRARIRLAPDEDLRLAVARALEPAAPVEPQAPRERDPFLVVGAARLVPAFGEGEGDEEQAEEEEEEEQGAQDEPDDAPRAEERSAAPEARAEEEP